MKFFLIVLLFSTSALAATSTKLLAEQLWAAMEKTNNSSYLYLDGIRNRLPENDPIKMALSTPKEFKRYQLVLREIFSDQVARQFSRKEITNLIKIYHRSEMTKMHDFGLEFWDVKKINQILKDHPKQ